MEEEPDSGPRFGCEPLGTPCLSYWCLSCLFFCLGLCYVSFSGKNCNVCVCVILQCAFGCKWYSIRQHLMMGFTQMCLVLDSLLYMNNLFTTKTKYMPLLFASRWLICTLAVRFFQTALNADLKIKSVGLFSVQGVSIQFHPQHTLVRTTVFTRHLCSKLIQYGHSHFRASCLIYEWAEHTLCCWSKIISRILFDSP